MLRQGFPHCAKFPTAASRRSLDRVSVPVCPCALSGRIQITVLVGHYPANKLICRDPLLKRIAPLTRRCYAVLAEVSSSYSPLQGRLVTCYSPVRHCTQVLLPFLVRLACVRHAASVDSEPGSNSRLKLFASPDDGGHRGLTAPQHLGTNSRARGDLPCENDQAKPDPISRLARSTNFSKILKQDPPERFALDRALTVRLRCPRTCCALFRFGLSPSLQSCAFLILADRFRLVNFRCFLRFLFPLTSPASRFRVSPVQLKRTEGLLRSATRRPQVRTNLFKEHPALSA